jgi:hypothetical protein
MVFLASVVPLTFRQGGNASITANRAATETVTVQAEASLLKTDANELTYSPPGRESVRVFL